MALRGERPILEIMFGDFVALGFDQIVNGIAKFREMYDDQVTVPLVVRTPMGGRRGYGPTHSQSLEKLLLGVPNIVVVAASECHDLRALLVGRGRGRPAGVLRREQAHVRAAEPSARGRAHRRARGARDRRSAIPALTFSGSGFSEGAATVVTYGGMLPVVLDAVTELILEHEIFCEVVALSQLLPMELEPVLESVARTGALVTAEEGTLTGGFGAEIAARVQEAAWGDLRRPVQRVAARDGIIPAARTARGRDAPERAGRRRRDPRPRRRAKLAPVLEIVLTREDANTEFALLAEWLVEDRAEVEQGQPVCVVETTKATVEVESPGAGTIVQLYEDGVEVELGKTIARIAENADELASLEAGRRGREAGAEARRGRAQGDAQGRRARGAPRDRPRRRSTSADSSRRRTSRRSIARAEGRGRARSRAPLLAGVSTDGVTLPASFALDETRRRARPRRSSSRSAPTRTRSARSRPTRRCRPCASTAPRSARA